MRIVFAGTPEFSIPVLDILLKEHTEHEIIAVYTQSDKPVGRGRNQQSSPVKQYAIEHDIPVRQPVSLKLPEEQTYLKSLQPDLMIVVAYGLLLPQIVLDIPTFGCINVHASLLPRWRGASPIQQAILSGDTKTGVSIMQMEAGLDTGPVFSEAHYEMLPTDTAGILHDKLALLGATTLSNILPDILLNSLVPRKQDESQTCYAGKITKQDGLIDWNDLAINIDRRVRAFNPWPVTYFYVQDNKCANEPHYVRLWQGNAISSEEIDILNYSKNVPVGTVLNVTPQGIDMMAGNNTVFRITELQCANARKLSVKDYLLGHSLFIPGKIL